ncbi:hypothetical protein KIPB_016038, partial [Kipferlia bialata]|eukprot:g16038.t1
MGAPPTEVSGMQYGISVYQDYQRGSLQEAPEDCPAGQLPGSVEFVLSDQLVDECKPGDRVDLVGVLKPMS